MAAYTASLSQPRYRDRHISLAAFGVLYASLGLICLLIVISGALSLLLVVTGAADGVADLPTASETLSAMVLYGAAAAWFIWLGIGSMLLRRWARALILVSSWIWLAGGFFSFLSSAGMFMFGLSNVLGFPIFLESDASLTALAVVVLTLQFIFVLLLPAILVLFYGGKNVKKTVEAYDPKIRWTDKCPLPVLAVSLLAFLFAVTLPANALNNWVFLFFGVILAGGPGAAVNAAAFVAALYVARGTYKLSTRAWWAATILLILYAISVVYTVSRNSMADVYELAGGMSTLVETYRQTDFPIDTWTAATAGIMMLALVGYVIYTRRYFPTEPGAHGLAEDRGREAQRDFPNT